MTFVPGKSGNPSGKPKLLVTNVSIKKQIGEFWYKSGSEIKSILEDPRSNMGDLMIASVMARAVAEGNYNCVAFLMDRAVGKVKEVQEDTNAGSADDLLDRIPREKLISLVTAEK